ncbi:TonB-dependent receptor [Paucibacter sp. JuS9]|uniref:TonB-dependent receptor n=1 Tax=Roseateles TaxID=93681 RepID=UPI002FE5DC37
MPLNSRLPLSATAQASLALLASLIGLPAWSQTSTTPAAAPAATTDAKLGRVEITGSSIKRLESEGALPVQVITREDIAKAGVTTAAEIMATITAGANNLTDGVSIGTGGFKDQMGFNSANLRGIGASSTLVLLNGRRMANFASPGDDSGVDLNNIPAAAIQRVEVLLDGASAIYGTDAIGGVVNFITRKDYQGVQLDAYASRTQEGGAGRRSGSIAGGFGDLARDGFNVFGVLDVQKTDRLSTAQRQFISDLKIPELLPHLLSSAGFPANIRLTSSQRNYLQDQNFKINGKSIVNRTINLSAPNCQPPHTLYLPDGIGGEDACTYDFMRDLELYPKSDKKSFLGRAVADIGGGHQVFAEVSLSSAKTWYVGTSNRVDADVLISGIPVLAATGLGGGDPDATVVVRTRMLEAGNRTSELTSTGNRVVLGATGTMGGWDYDTAFNLSSNRVSDRDVRGYVLYDKVLEGFLSGKLNPFASSGAAGKAYLDSIQVNDEVRRARGTMTSLDFKASKAIAKLDGGDLSMAWGAETRREQTKSHASDLLLSDNITGDWTPGDAQNTDYKRSMWAAYGELVAPVTKELELQAAVRHDHYQNIGGTTNPKLGLRYQPMKSLLVRGSVSTGFRAPSLNDLYRSVRVGSSAILPDPIYCAENDWDLGICALDWTTRTYSNPKLKPERSRQFSTGIVFEPTKGTTLSADYFYLTKRDLISTLGEDVILNNLSKYEPLTHRYSEDEQLAGCDYDPDDNSICFIELQKENRGRLKTSGLDLMADIRGIKTGVGTFGVRLTGTLTLMSKEQTGYGDPYISNLGKFVTRGVVQRWRHRLTLDWERGPFSLALSNHYMSGYEDQNSAIDTNTGTVVGANRVKAYSLWDLSGAWQASDSLTLRAGVKNLGDTSPPFSNQAYFFISGYDPSYTDPRGRAFYVSAQYRFR